MGKYISKIEELEVGQVVKARRGKIVDEGGGLYRVAYSKGLVKKKEIEGKIMSVDYRKGTFVVEMEGGEQEIIDLINYIVVVVPLVKKIWGKIKLIFNKIFKKKKK